MFRYALLAAGLVLAATAALPVLAASDAAAPAAIAEPRAGAPASRPAVVPPPGDRLPEPQNGQVSTMIRGALLYLSRR